MRTKSYQTNLISSCNRETSFGDIGKQWILDTTASVESLIPAYIIAESKNLIEFCWLVEMISKNGNQRLRITFWVRRRPEVFSFVGLAEKHAPDPPIFTAHLSGDMPSIWIGLWETEMRFTALLKQGLLGMVVRWKGHYRGHGSWAGPGVSTGQGNTEGTH